MNIDDLVKISDEFERNNKNISISDAFLSGIIFCHNMDQHDYNKMINSFFLMKNIYSLNRYLTMINEG